METTRHEKLLSEEEATLKISDGMILAFGDPAPMGIIRQIIRKKTRGLTVVASGMSLDMLIAGGCVSKVISYYAGGGFGVPVAPSFRRACESGELEVWECEEGILTTGLEAAGKALPYLPWRGGVGTSLPEVNRDLKLIEDPIKGETLIAVPAIKPDLAILHAAESDAYGNVQHYGGTGWLDLFLYRAAKETIVQVEKVISNEDVRANPWATTIASADGIVRMPYGAHPFYSRGYYVQDIEFLRSYIDVAKGQGEQLQNFLNRYFISPSSHDEYLEEIGIKRLLSLYEY